VTSPIPSAGVAPAPRPHWAALVGVGVLAGLLSGLFGVGGGILVVPALLLLGVDQPRAAGTSVTAILPTAIVGAIGYGLTSHIDWLAGILLAVGAVGGAQIGSLLLNRLPRRVLFWSFIALMLLVAASLWVRIPERDDTIEITVLTGATLVLLGLVVGILSALFGVGGGVMVVPALIVGYGASDLIAKGTSLLMMVPGSISATIANSRRGNIDFGMALLIGVPACVLSPLGLWAATAIPPLWSNIAFSALIVAVVAQLATRELRSPRTPN
jgi:uncharacterized membrane protein YfcA